MVRACVLDFQGKWEDYLPLVEFSYNNSYQSTNKMAPFEALYRRKCRTPLCWSNFDDALTLGPELIQETTEMIRKIQEHIKADRKAMQRKGKGHQNFKWKIKLFFKVSLVKGVRRFNPRGKLSPRHIEPYEIIKKLNPVTYRLDLLTELEHVHNVFHISQL